MTAKFLQQSTSVRNKLFSMAERAGRSGKGSHMGGSLSCLDILVYLYFHSGFTFAPNGTSRFVLSKGHAALCLYSVLGEYGLIDQKMLDQYPESEILLGHPTRAPGYGIELATGSLGMGASYAVGLALADRLSGGHGDSRVFVLCGDGELNEGSSMEALRSAVHNKLGNLVVLVDGNKYQQTGSVANISGIDLAAYIESLGFYVVKSAGHIYKDLKKSFDTVRTIHSPSVPMALIFETDKGRGLKDAGTNLSHHVVFNRGMIA